MNLLIIGAPGAGKGTMSNFIVDKYKTVHISTGDLLRQAIASNSDIGKIAKSYIDQGHLVPDSIIQDIITECLKKDEVKNGFLFDGYPRTVKQAESLKTILENLNSKIDAVIYLDVDDDVLIKRIEGRRICPKCELSYNLFFSPPKKEGVCNNCGTKLVLRSDDNPESIKKRLTEFRSNTQPVIDYYKKQNLVKHIDANIDRNLVFNYISEALEGIQ